MDGTFAPLKQPQFRILWLASLLSNLGSMVQLVAVSWQMTRLTSSVELVALVQSAQNLPIMLFSIVAGAFADSRERRSIMLFAQMLSLIAALALLIIGLSGYLTPWLILGLTFLIGSSTALNNPSWQAAIGDLVSKNSIPNAVSLNGLSTNLVRSVGPAVGGAIMAVAGATASFAFNVFSSVPLIGALARWKSPTPASDLPRERLIDAISDGFRFVGMSPRIVRTMLRASLFGIPATCILALLPVVADRQLGGGPLVYGTLFAGFGMGGVLGATLSAPLRSRFCNETIARLAYLVFSLASILLGLSSNLLVSLIAVVPAGTVWVAALSMFNSTTQLSTPRWVVGRVISIYQTVTFGGMAAGSWIWGLVAQHNGTSTTLMVAGLVVFLCGLVGFRFPVPANEDSDLSPSDQFQTPETYTQLQPQSGPVMVTIEYLIDESDVPAFLGIMAERRRIRIRDGARRWVLMQDLGNKAIWMEKYHVGNWAEYVRHNRRRTLADAQIVKNLHELHQGSEPPEIRRMLERRPREVQTGVEQLP